MSKTSPKPHRKPSRSSSASGKGTPGTAAKPAASRSHSTTPSSSHRRLHIALPSSASEIRSALGISEAELKAALDAIESAG
jgi:hypothetical protein